MKKLFMGLMVLAITSIFIANAAFAAITTIHMRKEAESITPATMGPFEFDLIFDTDTGLMTYTAATYDNPGDITSQGAWAGGTITIDSAGTGGIWSSTAYQSSDWLGTNPEQWLPASGLGTLYGEEYTGIIIIYPYQLFLGNFVFDENTGLGSYAAMPWDSGEPAADHYHWALTGAIVPDGDVPIPGAAWLLLSGLVGIIGLRRKS